MPTDYLVASRKFRLPPRAGHLLAAARTFPPRAGPERLLRGSAVLLLEARGRITRALRSAGGRAPGDLGRRIENELDPRPARREPKAGLPKAGLLVRLEKPGFPDPPGPLPKGLPCGRTVPAPRNRGAESLRRGGPSVLGPVAGRDLCPVLPSVRGFSRSKPWRGACRKPYGRRARPGVSLNAGRCWADEVPSAGRPAGRLSRAIVSPTGSPIGSSIGFELGPRFGPEAGRRSLLGRSLRRPSILGRSVPRGGASRRGPD